MRAYLDAGCIVRSDVFVAIVARLRCAFCEDCCLARCHTNTMFHTTVFELL